MKIIRVFPTRTSATPDDEDVRIDEGPGMFDKADEIHISVLFTWDIKRAKELADLWQGVAPVKMGGPALGAPSGEFVPGKYVKHGYTITSRGCPNKCKMCFVPKREGSIRELPIIPGNNVLDDNLLACSDEHIKKVFAMLRQQKGRKYFTGGFEAARLRQWHIKELETIKPESIFFAYDNPQNMRALQRAAQLLFNSKLTPHSFRCYVLIGYEGDTIGEAENRLNDVYNLGFMPMAMLYRGENGCRDPQWISFTHNWCRPAIIRKIARAA